MQSNAKREFRFPVEQVTYTTYRCPCGSDGIVETTTYPTGLDDADPDWGRADTEYYIYPKDPCHARYRVIDKTTSGREWILEEIGQPAEG